MPAPANIKLVVQKGPHQGHKYSFVKDKITLGRSPENDIVLINDPLVSRHHACIQVVNNEVEIVNLSEKNYILVNGENVQKWKLTHDTIFTLGDTEFLIQIEGQSVVAVKPTAAPKTKPISQPAIKATPQRPNNVVPRGVSAQRPQPFQPPKAGSMGHFQSQPLPKESLSFDNPKVRFYGIIIVVGLVFTYFMLSESETKRPKKPTMQYNDIAAIKLSSQEEKDLESKRAAITQQRQTASYARVEENFKKGMREYQLGNFARARDHFQLVLREQSNHALAQRYLYLSRVRFDEVVKSKINLGNMYYSANNFKLCTSLFQQVKDMLQGRDNDTNLQLAEQMFKKCSDAIEGIR